MIYWHLLDKGILPAKAWNWMWEVVSNERNIELTQDVYQVTTVHAIDEKSEILRKVCIYDNYYDD